MRLTSILNSGSDPDGGEAVMKINGVIIFMTIQACLDGHWPVGLGCKLGRNQDEGSVDPRVIKKFHIWFLAESADWTGLAGAESVASPSRNKLQSGGCVTCEPKKLAARPVWWKSFAVFETFLTGLFSVCWFKMRPSLGPQEDVHRYEVFHTFKITFIKDDHQRVWRSASLHCAPHKNPVTSLPLSLQDNQPGITKDTRVLQHCWLTDVTPTLPGLLKKDFRSLVSFLMTSCSQMVRSPARQAVKGQLDCYSFPIESAGETGIFFLIYHI